MVYTLAQFDDQRQPVNANLNVGVNSQQALVSVAIGTYDVANQTFTPSATGKDVKVQTIAPKPTNIATSVVKIRDGRQNPSDGSPVEFVINVTFSTPPAVPPTIELVSKQPVVTQP